MQSKSEARRILKNNGIRVNGSIIYNEPFKVHGMKVSDVPFLSIWCWPNNSSKKCEIVTSI